MSALKLSVAGGHLEEMLSALSDASDRLPEFRDALVNLVETSKELFFIELDRRAAARTDELVMRLYPGDRLLSLVAAFRARQPELFRLEHFDLLVDRDHIITTQGDAQCSH